MSFETLGQGLLLSTFVLLPGLLIASGLNEQFMGLKRALANRSGRNAVPGRLQLESTAELEDARPFGRVELSHLD
ncbi:MAG: hypothetical protein AAF533_21155 [Acidobacteriota bacterium]